MMKKLITWLIEHWYLTALVLFCVVLLQHGKSMYDLGFEKAKAAGDQALAELRLEHQALRAAAAEQNLALLRQQVERANQAERALLDAQDKITRLQQQLTRERIAYVSTQYRPAPGADPVPASGVVTCGWLRDFNAALGARVPSPAACRSPASAQEAAWPASGADTELLASGVSLADILAHARDYGAWALANLAQLNALLDLHDKETR